MTAVVPKLKNMATIVAIEGIHGCGKSTFIEALRKRGRTVIDEGFMQTEMSEFSPSGIARQTVWVANWIERAVKAVKRNGLETNMVYVDRSMWSAVIYNEGGGNQAKALQHTIVEAEKELEECGYNIVKVLLLDNHKAAWLNIIDRLKKEPHRKSFKEHDESHYENVWNKYYVNEKNRWDVSMNMPQAYVSEEVAIAELDLAVAKMIAPNAERRVP